jgi:hypothetical protein
MTRPSAAIVDRLTFGGNIIETGSAIRAAAEAAQVTLTGFCALAALAVARRKPGETAPGDARAGVEELAELQRELSAARNAVNRAGVNLNQAVAALNSNGRPPVWLEHAVDRVTRAVAEVDTVVARIHPPEGCNHRILVMSSQDFGVGERLRVLKSVLDGRVNRPWATFPGFGVWREAVTRAQEPRGQVAVTCPAESLAGKWFRQPCGTRG